MKFSEFPYQRIDMDALKQQIVSTTQKLQTAKNFQEADEAFVAMNELLGQSLMTQRTVAQIRRDVNTSDAFYDGEMAYYNRAVPELQPARKAWTDALLASHFRKELEEKYGNVTFLNAEISQKTFTPEMVPDLQRENELVTRYVKLIASAQIPFEGNAYTLAQLAPYKLDPDDTRRLAAWTAEGEWYNQHGAELDEIYDQLVKVRDAMGRKLGYDGYTQLGYYRMERNCYTAEDVSAFRAAVQIIGAAVVFIQLRRFIAETERSALDPSGRTSDGLAVIVRRKQRFVGGAQNHRTRRPLRIGHSNVPNRRTERTKRQLQSGRVLERNVRICVSVLFCDLHRAPISLPIQSL